MNIRYTVTQIVKMPAPRTKKVLFESEPVVEVIQEAQEIPVHSSDSEEETQIPDMMMDINTQQVMDEVREERQEQEELKAGFAKSRKRSLKEGKRGPTKKSKTCEEILEENQPTEDGRMSYLGLLIILWTPKILLSITDTIDAAQNLTLQDKKFAEKRHLFTMSRGILSTSKQLKAQGKNFANSSIITFIDALAETKSFMTFTKPTVPGEIGDSIMDYLIRCSPGVSSSLPTTTITGTSSTIVPTVTEVVDVPYDNSSRKTIVITPEPKQIRSVPYEGTSTDLVGDSLDELFQVSTSAPITGGICQSICKRMNDTYCTWSSPGECGYQVVKMDIFDYQKIAHLSKDQWWKHANYRTTFVTSSIADPKHVLAQKLLQQVASDLKEIPGIKRDQRANKSWNSSRNDQQHQ